MKQRFYVFIQCDPGTTYQIGQQIVARKLEYVAEVSSISGKWDLLVRIEIDNRRDVGAELARATLDIAQIRRTKTLVAYDIHDPSDIWFDDD